MKSKELKNIPTLRFSEFLNDGEWEEKELRNLITYFKGFAFQSKDYTSNGRRIVRVSDMGFDYIKDETNAIYIDEQKANEFEKWKLQKNDLVITTVGSKPPVYDSLVGRTIIVETKDEDSLLNQNAVCIRANKIEQVFLNVLFKRSEYVSFIESIIRGNANQGSIALEDLFKYMCFIPSSTEEQQKIANCLSSIDNLITAQSKKVETLKEHKKGLMQQLFPTDGEEIPKLRFPEFENAPKWEKKKLGDIGNVLQGYGFPEKLQGKTEGRYPFYKVSDISNAVQSGNNFIYLSNNYIDEDVLTDLKAKTIPSGVTIFAKIGEAIRSNRRAITTQECLVDNNVSGIKAIAGKATDLYIFYTMSKIDLIEYCGGVVPSINKTALENIQIFCPPTTIEQQKIADCLSSIDELITAQSKKVETLKEHKKGLMQKLFPSNDEVSK